MKDEENLRLKTLSARFRRSLAWVATHPIF